MLPLLSGLALTLPAALALAVGPSASPGTPVLHFRDPAIVEASDLVVQDGLYLTTNDSGDTGRVFAVDSSGATVGVTRWSRDPVDTEALAPGGDGTVWVGDIGDNLARRPYVVLARVPVGPGDRTVHPTTYRLRYPDGAVDAETLMRDLETGRLYIATKGVFGGVLYAVPSRLRASGVNRLKPVGRVLPVATDGAFFPDGRHLVVRSYTTAVVYDWPSMQPIGSVALPQQRQGEGIAVAADGRVYVSSEGADSRVLQVRLPRRVEARVSPPSESAGPTTGARPSSAASPEEASRPLWPWLAGGLLGLAALAVLLRSLRPPSR
ncbi:MAG: hypothetical protein QM747_10790 [Nocardioides sp.]